ncbi:PIR protein [Plasmodium vivax]|uniref:VIR protein n=1 Tax=Plasmodium vivax TaxID=5855 RepID=A0A565A534_PLAVI|nr:PIR protein [Plasmodium vivax]
MTVGDTFTEQLKNIKKYLEKCTANDLKNESKYCGYLNYWINKHVSSTYKDNKDLFFNHFRTFIENFNGTPNSNTCTSKLKLMDNELLKKMNKIYDFYDYYYTNHLLTLNRSHEDSYICKQFEDLVNDYNKYTKEYKENDDNLLNKLKDIICLIKHDDWLSKNYCKSNVLILISPKSESLYDKNTCTTLQNDLVKLKDLIIKEQSTDRQTSTDVDRDSARGKESGRHHMSGENPGSEGAHGLNGGVTPAGTFVNKFFGRNKSAYRNIDNIKNNALTIIMKQRKYILIMEQ